MFNVKTFLQQSLLALTLAMGSAAAMAGPTYHVNVNTAGLSGTGWMDFTFLSINTPAQAQVSLSNFSGAFGTEIGRDGDVTGAIPGLVDILNTPGFNALTQAVTLGGLFAFDVNFSGDFLLTGGNDGSTFAVALYEENFANYIGVTGSFVQFELASDAAGTPGVTFSGANALAEVAAVPEPSELLLMLTGLGLMGIMVRRRRAPR